MFNCRELLERNVCMHLCVQPRCSLSLVSHRKGSMVQRRCFMVRTTCFMIHNSRSLLRSAFLGSGNTFYRPWNMFPIECIRCSMMHGMCVCPLRHRECSRHVLLLFYYLSNMLHTACDMLRRPRILLPQELTWGATDISVDRKCRFRNLRHTNFTAT